MAGLEQTITMKPDLIFLDIELPYINGIQMLKSIPSATKIPLVVFVTGYHAHALAAFEADALAYLLKPVEEARLASTLERARRLVGDAVESGAEQRHLSEVVAQRKVRIDQVVGKSHERFVLLRPAEILYFSADGGLVRAHTAKDTYMVDLTLNELEDSLAHLRFFRAHRSALINMIHIHEIQPSFRSRYILILNDAAKTEIHVSERQSTNLRARVPGL
jgi:DNA-binding LytR/AlgR family response regulator